MGSCGGRRNATPKPSKIDVGASANGKAGPYWRSSQLLRRVELRRGLPHPEISAGTKLGPIFAELMTPSVAMGPLPTFQSIIRGPKRCGETIIDPEFDLVNGLPQADIGRAQNRVGQRHRPRSKVQIVVLALDRPIAHHGPFHARADRPSGPRLATG